MEKKTVYFATTLISGDNLGMNSLLGFIESFSNTIFCRICYILPEDSKKLVAEDESLLRTVDKYEEDVKNLNPSSTGVKEPCAFHKLKNYHAITKSYLDLTHDGPEGFYSYDMASIITELVEQGEISVEMINVAMCNMDFGFEKDNLPMDLSLQYLKSHQKLKMSASECTFFTRYFSMIVGDHISEGNKVYEFYIVLRQIVSILTAPILTESLLLMLQDLIEEHHKMHVTLFGDLKPKHHFLLHYVRIIRQNGPVAKISTLRFESKHRVIKAIVNSMSSNKDIPLTVGSRIQLSLLETSSMEFEERYTTLGAEQEEDDTKIHFLFNNKKKCHIKISVNGFDYSEGTVIVYKISKSGPQFGKIEKLFAVDDQIHFRFIPFKTIGFSCHYFGYSVVLDESRRDMVEYDDLPCKVPCLLFCKKDCMYISTRHAIV